MPNEALHAQTRPKPCFLISRGMHAGSAAGAVVLDLVDDDVLLLHDVVLLQMMLLLVLLLLLLQLSL
eukprot:3140594-Amphidinium_carterae.1